MLRLANIHGTGHPKTYVLPRKRDLKEGRANRACGADAAKKALKLRGAWRSTPLLFRSILECGRICLRRRIELAGESIREKTVPQDSKNSLRTPRIAA